MSCFASRAVSLFMLRIAGWEEEYVQVCYFEASFGFTF
jgi:hypothetical protein